MARQLQIVSLSQEEQMQKQEEQLKDCFYRMFQLEPVEGIYCNMTWDTVMCWDRTPAGTIATQQCPDYIHGFNTAAFATRECLSNGTWKPNLKANNTDGWTNFTACGHGGKNDILLHLSTIKVMTNIGYGISLTALVIAVLIMVLSKRLHCKSNSLHINLFMAFIFRASISFIKDKLFVNHIGLEIDITYRQDGTMLFREDIMHWQCKLLITVFTYTVCASLMWIFMEGLYLHMLVYRTLFTERHGVRLYFIIGWFSPLLYIIPWVLVRIYLDDNLCWHTYYHEDYIWIIKAPICITVLINFLFFIDIVRVLCVRVRSHRYPKGSSKHLRKITKFALVLIPLFGVIYIVVASFPEGVSNEADIYMLYFEMFYNSIQGFILALLFCFLNEEVHNEIRRHWYRKRFTGFSTRSSYFSWRKASGVSRAPMTAGSHMKDSILSSDSEKTAPVKANDYRPMNWKSTFRKQEECFPLEMSKFDSSAPLDCDL